MVGFVSPCAAQKLSATVCTSRLEFVASRRWQVTVRVCVPQSMEQAPSSRGIGIGVERLPRARDVDVMFWQASNCRPLTYACHFTYRSRNIHCARHAGFLLSEENP